MNQFNLEDEEEESIQSNAGLGENDQKEDELNNNKRPRRDKFGYFIDVENDDSSSSDNESINKKKNEKIKNNKNEDSYSENNENNFEKNNESINEDEINHMSRNISDNLVNSFKPRPVPGSPKFCKKSSNNNNNSSSNESNIGRESNSENDLNKKSTSSIIKYINTNIKIENPNETSMNSNNNNFVYKNKYNNISPSQGETSNKEESSNSYQNQVNRNEETNQKNKNEENVDEDEAFLMREVLNSQKRHIVNEKAKINNNKNLHEEEPETFSGNSKYDSQNHYNEFKIENNAYHESEINSINKEEESNKETLNDKINNLNNGSSSHYYYEKNNNEAEEDEKNNSSSQYYFKEKNSPYNYEQRRINKINESEAISESSTNNKNEEIYSKKKPNNNKRNNIPFMNNNYKSKHGSQTKNQKNNSKYTSPKRNENNKYNFNNNKKAMTPYKNMRKYIKNIDKNTYEVYTPTKLKKVNYNQNKNRALTPDLKIEKKNKKYIPYNNSKKNINSYYYTKTKNTSSNLMISKTTKKKIEDSIKKCSTNEKISIVGFIKCLFDLNIINEIFKSKDIINNLDIEELRNIIKYINEKNINKLKEVEFIEQFWFIINPSVTKFISIQILSKMLKILFSANSNIKDITNSIVNLLNKYNNIININGFYSSPLRNKKYNKNEKWQLPKFVKVFLDLKNKSKINKEKCNIIDNNLKKNDPFFKKYYPKHNQRNKNNGDNSFYSSNTSSKNKDNKIKILNKTVDIGVPYNLDKNNKKFNVIQIQKTQKSPNKNIYMIPYTKVGTPNKHLTKDENIEKQKGNNIVKKKYIIDRKRYQKPEENNNIDNFSSNKIRNRIIPSPKKKNSFTNKTQNYSQNEKQGIIEDAFITIHIKVPNGELKPFEIHNKKLGDIIESVENFCKTYNINEEMKSLILQKVLEYKNSFFNKNTFNKIEINA